jgi:uncharacterized RDD family membrane protein YckC
MTESTPPGGQPGWPTEPTPAEPTPAAPTPPQAPTTEPTPAAPTPPPTAPPPAPPVAWQQPELEPGPAPGVEFAPHGERLVAYIFDVLIVGVIYIVALILLGILSVIAPILGLPLLIAAAILIPILYFPWFWARGGQTPGMRAFGLHVVRDRDGGSIGWGSALLRLIGYWINSLVFYIGFIWILIDKRRRGWHDLIASTVVIKRPKV